MVAAPAPVLGFPEPAALFLSGYTITVFCAGMVFGMLCFVWARRIDRLDDIQVEVDRRTGRKS